MNGTIRAYGETENIVTVLPSTFKDTTVTVELTRTSATALGFDSAVSSATIRKSSLIDLCRKADTTGTTVLFG